jgi:membrane-bound ClpP family serine protease
MPLYLIITFISLGILLLLVEFLVIPGVTIAGIAGTIFIVGGLICSYIFRDAREGNIITLVSLTAIVFIFVLAFKSRTWQRFGLKTEIDSHVGENVDLNFKIGDTGRAVSKLSPIGKVMINDTLVEASSMGTYIDAGSEIRIVRTEKNKLFVEPIKS